ncbi:hypothetical protein [Vulcanisaeta sp. JCM 16161]|uniref:hypothetical protein n=1 Tax=Vulcanisaeta sp. JCM 16161 TaxID=1295372 RepID=UPI000A8DAE96|nr:hypothetical protein [Vulcanisaeta sp. JCM 16161]
MLIGVTILGVFSPRIDPTMGGWRGWACCSWPCINRFITLYEEECLDNSMSIDVAEDFMRRLRST